MPEKILTLQTIVDHDGGKVALAFDHEITQMIRDVMDRPGDKSVRKTTLVISAVPNLDEQAGALDTVGVTFRVSSTTPVRRSIEYPMLATNAGKLMFQPSSPRDPRQTELPYSDRVDQGEPEQRPEEVIGGDDE